MDDLATTSGQPRTAAFDTYQFLTIEVLSAVSFYNAILDVNKKFLKTALSELAPYGICMPVSFLVDLTQIISMNQSSRINNCFCFFLQHFLC